VGPYGSIIGNTGLQLDGDEGTYTRSWEGRITPSIIFWSGVSENY
jgi:hypothetical protein